MDPFGDVRLKDQRYWMQFKEKPKKNLSSKLSLKELTEILKKSV
jgi:hypothetical protein